MTWTDLTCSGDDVRVIAGNFANVGVSNVTGAEEIDYNTFVTVNDFASAAMAHEVMVSCGTCRVRDNHVLSCWMKMYDDSLFLYMSLSPGAVSQADCKLGVL